MSDDKKSRPCPDLIKVAGAKSVLLRHLILDGASVDEVKAGFAALDKAVEAVLPTLKGLGIAVMEIAEGRRLMLDAEEEIVLRSRKRGLLLQQEGHCSWMLMLQRHKIDTPTDDDIQAVHKAELQQAGVLRSAAQAATLSNLAARGNSR